LFLVLGLNIGNSLQGELQISRDHERYEYYERYKRYKLCERLREFTLLRFFASLVLTGSGFGAEGVTLRFASHRGSSAAAQGSGCFVLQRKGY
jgi:hypothetical protein